MSPMSCGFSISKEKILNVFTPVQSLTDRISLQNIFKLFHFYKPSSKTLIGLLIFEGFRMSLKDLLEILFLRYWGLL